MTRAFNAPGPAWLKGDQEPCETCGHWSEFEAGFKYGGAGYEGGWYEDEISCFGGISYDHWLWNRYNDEVPEDEETGPEDTAESFREFLTENERYEEAQQILTEMDRLGL